MRSVAHSVPHRVSIIRFTVAVVGGVGYHDFTAYGKLQRVIITKPRVNGAIQNQASYTWNINDDHPQGIAGGGTSETHDEDNFPEDDTPCQGLNRCSMAGTDGVYTVGIYGEGYGGDWVYP